ncbi:MAG: 50S ribosomal protein L23 [bacterium]
MDLEDVIIEPVITEKSVREQEKNNHYTFSVHPESNKIEIRKAIEKQFDVNVSDVRTANYRGKERRVRYASGYTSRWKKAVVSLEEGDHIEMMEGMVG